MDDVTAQLDDLLADAFSSGPASEAFVAAAEQMLGLLFTPSYRLFLSRFGASLSTDCHSQLIQTSRSNGRMRSMQRCGYVLIRCPRILFTFRTME